MRLEAFAIFITLEWKFRIQLPSHISLKLGLALCSIKTLHRRTIQGLYILDEYALMNYCHENKKVLYANA